MPATYNASLATDKDWVRMLAGDRNTLKAVLQDEEIKALLAEEPNKYYAAARAVEMIITKTGGLVSKQVEDLRLTYAGADGQDAYLKYADELRKTGARKLLEGGTRARTFRVL